jgi:hypothetical protein
MMKSVSRRSIEDTRSDMFPARIQYISACHYVKSTTILLMLQCVGMLSLCIEKLLISTCVSLLCCVTITIKVDMKNQHKVQEVASSLNSPR